MLKGIRISKRFGIFIPVRPNVRTRVLHKVFLEFLFYFSQILRSFLSRIIKGPIGRKSIPEFLRILVESRYFGRKMVHFSLCFSNWRRACLHKKGPGVMSRASWRRAAKTCLRLHKTHFCRPASTARRQPPGVMTPDSWRPALFM